MSQYVPNIVKSHSSREKLGSILDTQKNCLWRSGYTPWILKKDGLDTSEGAVGFLVCFCLWDFLFAADDEYEQE